MSRIAYLAARIFSTHIPVVRKGRRYASVVLRLFNGKADRYGNQGIVAAIELHVQNIRDAARDGVLWVDKKTGRATITLAKLGPAELRRLGHRLVEAADAMEMAMMLGVGPDKLEEAWLKAKRAATAPKRGAAADSGDPLAGIIDADNGGEPAETGEEDLFA